MRVVIATDSFKGSLTSYEAGVAILRGIKEAVPSAEGEVLEVADGGEGTFEVITKAREGDVITVPVTGPLGETVEARYGIVSGDVKTAVMDISQACGLPLVPVSKRNPLYTTTEGIGEIIIDALNRGCRKFIVGLGGSSTNDVGAGMLNKLGVKFTDASGCEITRGASGLSSLKLIDVSGLDERLKESEFLIACDVTNPLTGDNGCSMVFAPQKGADYDSCRLMDNWIAKFADLTRDIYEDSDPSFPGSGAAGGLGFAFRTFLNGSMVSGASLVLEQIGLRDHLKDADIVITGEGKFDAQTLMGKVPYEVIKLGKECGLKTMVFAGKADADEASLSEFGIDEVYSISEGISKEESMSNAASLLTNKAREVFTWKTSSRD